MVLQLKVGHVCMFVEGGFGMFGAHFNVYTHVWIVLGFSPVHVCIYPSIAVTCVCVYI